MNIETVLLIVIVTFACGFVLDRWNMRLSRSRRRQSVSSSRAVGQLEPTPKSGSPSARTAPRPWKWSRSPPRRQAPGRNVVDSLAYVNDLVHDLFDRVAVGAAVLHARPGGWLAAPRRPLHPTRFTALTPLRVRP